MAIDDKGNWWIGTEPNDIGEFLDALIQSECGYAITARKLLACSCGSIQFSLERAGNVTKRNCTDCGTSHFICRSPHDWDEAATLEVAEPFSCPECHGKAANVLMGFAGYEEDSGLDGVKWFYVGVRCAQCGILGSFNDGKVGRGPAKEVYETA